MHRKTIQRFAPTDVTLESSHRFRHEGIAVNIRSAVDVNAVSGVQSLDQIPAPAIVVIDRGRQPPRRKKINGSYRVVLCFIALLMSYEVPDAYSSQGCRGQKKQKVDYESYARCLRLRLGKPSFPTVRQH